MLMLNVVRQVIANGGDFTIAMWVRVSPQSDKRFFPFFNFYSSISPPLHNLMIGRWENPNGEVRLNTNCHPGSARSRNLNENIELNRLSDTEWNFISITRRNSSKLPDTTVQTNLGTNWEASSAPTCVYNSTFMIQAIEIDTASRFTPIMLIPEAIPTAKVQDMFYLHASDIKHKSGPASTNKVRMETRVPVSKEDYSIKSVLMAPPIIFQVPCVFT